MLKKLAASILDVFVVSRALRFRNNSEISGWIFDIRDQDFPSDAGPARNWILTTNGKPPADSPMRSFFEHTIHTVIV